MRIASVNVTAYRCLKELQLDISDYTVLIGPNGSGKSSVLYALDWFFNGGILTDDDLHGPMGSSEFDEIEVEVTFADLDAEDRRVFEQYGRGDTARLRRSWSKVTGKAKMIGNARQGPGFADVRAVQAKVTDMRPIYKGLRATMPELAEVTAKDDILVELTRWESDPSHVGELVEIDNDDATHMFGIDGPNALARRMRMVLVPAAANLADQVGAAGSGSALANLIGSLMKEAVTAARLKWETEFATEIQKLESSIKSSVATATRVQEVRVNERLGTFVPNAEIKFSSDPPLWNLKGDGSLRTDVVIDGIQKDVSRQGHGVQRAVMIAMLQALLPDEAMAQSQHSKTDDETEDEAKARLTKALEALPALIVGIEEPEIYQHPIRARNFARVLSALGKRPSSQVILATHSPYFVLPEQFSSLRRFSLQAGASSTSETSVSAVAQAARCNEARVEKFVEKEVPRTFSEGFFADAVVFVEGDTDRVVIEVIAERLNQSFDAEGVAVLAVGSKENLLIPYQILAGLKIPTYLIADCDSLGAARKHAVNPDSNLEAGEASHKNATEILLGWLPVSMVAGVGTLPFSYGDPSVVTQHYALLKDDLEEELAAWPSFVDALSGNGGALRMKKDVAAYRSAAMEADMTDLPPIFSKIIDAAAGVKNLT